jgi:muramidase (phage lysozyme)
MKEETNCFSALLYLRLFNYRRLCLLLVLLSAQAVFVFADDKEEINIPRAIGAVKKVNKKIIKTKEAAKKAVGKVQRLTSLYSLDKKLGESDGEEIKQNLLPLLARRNVRIFLEVIRIAEAGEPNIMVGGKCHSITLEKHPAEILPSKCRFRFRYNGRTLVSTASGNYQITYSNWKRLQPFLNLSSFSETNQALAALELIRRDGSLRRGFLALLQNDVKAAIRFATQPWASSPYSTLPGGKVNYMKIYDVLNGKAAVKSFDTQEEKEKCSCSCSCNTKKNNAKKKTRK